MSSTHAHLSSLTHADVVGTVARGMETTVEISHFGHWLKRRIAATTLTQKDFADRHGIDYDSLRGWLGKASPPISLRNQALLARALGMEAEEIEAMLPRQAKLAVSPREIPLLNRPGESVRLPPVVPILGKVSASRWSETAEGGYLGLHFDDPELFGLVCDGNCMEPDYHDGEYVLFSPRLVERDGLRDGADCGVQLDGAGDGQSTFKRVFSDPKNPSLLLLKCANPKLRAVMRVEREKVVRIGIAVWAIRPAKRK